MLTKTSMSTSAFCLILVHASAPNFVVTRSTTALFTNPYMEFPLSVQSSIFALTISAPTHGFETVAKFAWQCTHDGEKPVLTAIDLRTYQRPRPRRCSRTPRRPEPVPDAPPWWADPRPRSRPPARRTPTGTTRNRLPAEQTSFASPESSNARPRALTHSNTPITFCRFAPAHHI